MIYISGSKLLNYYIIKIYYLFIILLYRTPLQAIWLTRRTRHLSLGAGSDQGSGGAVLQGK